MPLKDAIAQLAKHEDLTRAQAESVMREIMSGAATPVQTAALLTALHVKGETVEEIAGMATVMRDFATRVVTSRRPLVDTCGTGGDHSGTFNISTAAAFVVAGAGIAVAKHGNRSATSRCGSADVLEALGVNINASPEVVGRCIDEVGIGFLFARALHGAMKHVAPVRAELPFRTVFNILGPLTNPAGADGQVVGVFEAKLVRPLAEVLAQLGARHAFVVAGSDGMDELTLAGSSKVAETVNGELRCYDLTPADFGLASATKEQLHGGDADKNARILRAVLEGRPGPHRDIVLLNAAPAIVAGQGADYVAGAMARARDSVDSGAALRKLEQLVQCSHDIR